jgi:hypothetical protein
MGYIQRWEYINGERRGRSGRKGQRRTEGREERTRTGLRRTRSRYLSVQGTYWRIRPTRAGPIRAFTISPIAGPTLDQAISHAMGGAVETCLSEPCIRICTPHTDWRMHRWIKTKSLCRATQLRLASKCVMGYIRRRSGTVCLGQIWSALRVRSLT